MGLCQRTQKNKSVLDVAKNYRGFLVLLPLVVLACSQKTKSPEKVVAETFKTAMKFRPSGEPLTKLGTNDSPSWSEDGSYFLFVSRLRPSHANAQIYEGDVIRATERRVTFSDGDASSPHYLSGEEKLIYASTTDELKERPVLLKKKFEQAENYPPSELYMSRLNGLDIIRLTQHQGYDGLLKPSTAHDLVFFFSSLKPSGNRNIMKLHAKHKTMTDLFPNDKEDRREFVSMNGRFAWLTTVPGGETKLMLAEKSLKNAKPAQFGKAMFKDLSWVPASKELKTEEGLLATVTFPENPRNQIFILYPTKNCLAPLLQSQTAELSQGVLSPDLKKLLYVSNEIGGQSQILVINIDWSKVICDKTGNEDGPKDRP